MIPALTALMVRTDTELAVRQRPDGSYQTVAGLSIAGMHAFNMRLAALDSGMLSNAHAIWCLVLAPTPPMVQHVCAVSLPLSLSRLI